MDLSNVKELDKMNLAQDHEQRITRLEVTMNGLAEKMDSVEKVVKEGNNEQKEMLQSINQRMVDEFFHKRRTNLDNRWKVVLTLLGGGSFLYLVFDKITLLLGGN